MTRLAPASGRRTVAELARHGRRGRHGLVWARWLPAHDGEARVAFAVGRAVGPAVVRNRVRRRLRAILRDLSGVLAPGTYLFGAGSDAATASYQELQQDVTTTLRHLGAVPPALP